MKIKDIVEALNHYYLAKFPNAKGWFIVKETTEPTLVNAYKQKKAELFYHLPGKNEKGVTKFLKRKIPVIAAFNISHPCKL